ncbi:MAG: protein translocase subunit SecD [Eubacterium sp.]|nr:protein translocase subunit SecD [Eubacterium sp.]
MKKKQSIVVLFVMAIVTILLGWTVLFGWGSHHTGAMKNIRLGLDLAGGVSITYEATDATPSQDDMDDTINKLQQRVSQYSTEANVYQQGLNRINVEIPGVTDANEILEDLGKPGSLTFTDESGNVVLEGTDIADAQGNAYTDTQTGEHKYVVELTMTEEGKQKFADATTANVGKTISINYDGSVVSAPRVNEAITQGKAEISGMADIEEAKQLASFIRIGSLSLEQNEIYSNVVGAQLGQDAISTSLLAGLIGILIVIAFMIFVYRISGLVAGWALIDFVFLFLGFMNAFDVTLTLPGIAGVILTIGMAVDANVIIYARSREELAAGRSLNQALHAGFHKAFSAIFDGNVTTLIAAAVLYILGTGSVQGFATTLAIGTILSMFTCLALSRWLSYAFYGVGVHDLKLYGKIKPRKPIDFVGKRFIGFAIALILIISVPVGMGVFSAKSGSPLNYSLDFIGGTATTVDFGEEMSLSDLDEKVEPVVAEVTGNNDIQFQKISGTTQVVIKTQELNLDKRNELNAALADNFSNVDESLITAENISSIISGEMRQNAIIAVIVAVICMLFYIFVRFRDFRFASSAVLALIHDIAVVVAFYVWFRASVGSTFIAVMLTILGYSINSTIVIFDRVRENLPIMRGSSYRLIVNTAITQTLTRSLYSNITTFITIFVLYLMGVPSVREFALPIIIGLVAGCFSSVFVTGALWYVMKTKNGKEDKPYEKNITVKEDGEVVAEAAAAAAEAKTSAAAEGVKNAAVSYGKKAKVDKTQYSSVKPKKGRNRH